MKSEKSDRERNIY